MTTDFEDRLRAELAGEEAQVPIDLDAVLDEGREKVRGRRLGWTVTGLAVLAVVASILTPLLLSRADLAVPVPASPSTTATAARRPLEATIWRLTSLGGVAPGADSRLTLVVDGNRVRGSSGCGDFTGDLARNGQRWAVSNLRIPAPFPCPSTNIDRMNRYFGLLEQVDRADLGEAGLTLTGRLGSLEFAAGTR
jgi:hypothetical protein